MPSEVRLTRAQKWDLLRMSGAAVVSTVFFAVPMFLVRPTVTRPDARAAMPATPATISGDVTGKPATVSEARLPDPVSVDTVSVVTSTEVAVVTTPVLQLAAAPTAPRRRAPAALIQARARSNAPAATPFGRRLARLIAGNGRYGVRPFPSVNTPGS
jgi:hypothetical protein